MSFRFRRSIKLLPGIRWNLGAKSSSLSFGGRGLHYTVGTRGKRATVGLPGTGISYTQTYQHAHPHIELPPQEWIQKNMVDIRFKAVEKQEHEKPIRTDQIEKITELSPNINPDDLKDWGERQASELIKSIKEKQEELNTMLFEKWQNEQATKRIVKNLIIFLVIAFIIYALIQLGPNQLTKQLTLKNTGSILKENVMSLHKKWKQTFSTKMV